MIQRTDTHIIDTLAIREIFTQMPENWLVRGLDERDYGIDLKIEKFNGNEPTGSFSLVQVKGTRDIFEGKVKLAKFPVKTLEYAELFPEPFFIFYTSVTNQLTYYVWAQKYIREKFKNDKWRNQQSVTIHFPENNIFGTDASTLEMENIMKELSIQKIGIKFLYDFERLIYSWENYKAGCIDEIDYCVTHAKRILRHNVFYEKYRDYHGIFESFELLNCLEDLRDRPIKNEYNKSDDDNRRLHNTEDMVCALELCKKGFLDDNHT
jgi:hypothetical protein